MSQTHVDWAPQPSRFASQAEADTAARTYGADLPDGVLARAIAEDPAQGCFDCAYDECHQVLVRCVWHWRSDA
jgi:hypothetical protein